jgi:hypothetical protein
MGVKVGEGGRQRHNHNYLLEPQFQNFEIECFINQLIMYLP